VSERAARSESGDLRAGRDGLIADTSLRGPAFGHALADLLDRTFAQLIDNQRAPVPVALVALGSYARRELCPGSDVDVVLLSTPARGLWGRRAPDLRRLAEHLWYPLWDAGFVLGHATRTVRDALALAETDLDSLTALLGVRHIAGNPDLTAELDERGKVLARKRRDRVVDALASASARRRLRPGPIAEMLEPDLKRGGGGLRDLQSLEWAGWAIRDHPAASRTHDAPDTTGGLSALRTRGYLSDTDIDRIEAARALLLDLRVTLHRLTASRSDRLALQEQDAVAAMIGADDADDMARHLASAARAASWAAQEVWSRLRDALSGPAGRVVRADRPIAEGVSLREGRIVLGGIGSVSAGTALEAAAGAAENGAPFDRASLERLRDMEPPTWDVWERAAFLRLLRAGESAVAVFEALDHVGALARLLPEWEVVRSRPQRNAYHRFTVDRHMLETVAECARLLDAGDAPGSAFDAVVARACRRPGLLLLAALLHDLGKGLPGDDHTVRGAAAARKIVQRMKLDSEAVEVVPWLVRDHLSMAETATRRDLSDAKTVSRFAEALCGDPERLRLLYLLTIGDSRATGPAAWSGAKAALVRDLFAKSAALVEPAGAEPIAVVRTTQLAARIGEAEALRHLAALPDTYVPAFDADEMAHHHALLSRGEITVSSRDIGDDMVGVTVIAPDRVGLLATVAGALSAAGLGLREASLFTTTDGVALDVFRGVDLFGRFAGDAADRLTPRVEDALHGRVDVGDAMRTHIRNYRQPDQGNRPVEVSFDLEASDTATVVEVHTDDRIGLLYHLACIFASLHTNVSIAKVATLGDHVVDVFYVRDSTGDRITDPAAISALKGALLRGLAER